MARRLELVVSNDAASVAVARKRAADLAVGDRNKAVSAPLPQRSLLAFAPDLTPFSAGHLGQAAMMSTITAIGLSRVLEDALAADAVRALLKGGAGTSSETAPDENAPSPDAPGPPAPAPEAAAEIAVAQGGGPLPARAAPERSTAIDARAHDDGDDCSPSATSAASHEPGRGSGAAGAAQSSNIAKATASSPFDAGGSSGEDSAAPPPGSALTAAPEARAPLEVAAAPYVLSDDGTRVDFSAQATLARDDGPDGPGSSGHSGGSDTITVNSISAGLGVLVDLTAANADGTEGAAFALDASGKVAGQIAILPFVSEVAGTVGDDIVIGNGRANLFIYTAEDGATGETQSYGFDIYSGGNLARGDDADTLDFSRLGGDGEALPCEAAGIVVDLSAAVKIAAIDAATGSEAILTGTLVSTVGGSSEIDLALILWSDQAPSAGDRPTPMATIENVTGSGGDDTIAGNAADNIFSGGLGADTFVFRDLDLSNGIEIGQDVVTDFSREAGDRLVVSAELFGLDLTQSQFDLLVAFLDNHGRDGIDGVVFAIDEDNSITLAHIFTSDIRDEGSADGSLGIRLGWQDSILFV